MTENQHLHETEALCPVCLATLPAEVFADGDGVVWMERTCPEHGRFCTRMWHDSEHYQLLRSMSFPRTYPHETFPTDKPCPFSCGPCSRHRRQGTLLEIEVTQRCNLHCPVCFMSAEDDESDPTLDEIASMYDTIARITSTDCGVQITGGEPTCREDLEEIVRMGRARGFWGVEVNTNGLRIAHEDGYLERLKAAGCTGIYLSFDGFTNEVYQATCGANLLDVKMRVVERCRESGLQVVLAMTVVSGLNDDQLGQMVRFAIDNSDIVVGLALQPAFTSGRFEADRVIAMNMGDVIKMLEDQTDGLIVTDDIWPLGCSNPLCDTGTYLAKSPDSTDPSGYIPATRGLTREQYLEAYNPSSPQGSVFTDILNSRGLDLEGGISLIIMNYMDVNSMDLQRLQECSMFVTVPDGRTIPFCSYHMTDRSGKRIYPPWGKEELA